MLIPSDRSHAERLEDKRHHDAACEYRAHGLPRSDTSPEKDDGTDGDGDDRCLTDTARDETCDGVARLAVGVMFCANCPSGVAAVNPSGKVLPRPKMASLAIQTLSPLIANGYEKKRNIRAPDSHIEDVHTRTAEDLLAENNNGKGARRASRAV